MENLIRLDHDAGHVSVKKVIITTKVWLWHLILILSRSCNPTYTFDYGALLNHDRLLLCVRQKLLLGQDD